MKVYLTTDDHPFAYLFDKSLPDPAAKTAAAAHRTQDFWEVEPGLGVYIRHHCQPRKGYFVPDDDIIRDCELSSIRHTDVMDSSPEGDAVSEWDQYLDENGHQVQGKKHANMWVGTTYLFSKSCKDPKAALASIKRDKGEAKKKARAQGFSYMDQLFQDQPCMKKPVTVMVYDMKPFLQSCVDRYVQLAGRDAKPLKVVTTPFHEERIARPVGDEPEKKGVLAPIAARVLMKILFAARMARFDLLRAVQGLAARVTKWSYDCDRALHRLVCYIHSTLDLKLKAFVGDTLSECKLWCFADADHAGEYDNRSTTGCFLVLVGPNTYFPLTAFSKKQTSVSMSSTESEVVAANVSLRAAGLPSSGLWAYLQNAGGDGAMQRSTPGGLPNDSLNTPSEKDGEYWEFIRHRRLLVRVHPKKRSHLFDPSTSKTIPVPIHRIGNARTTVMITKGGIDFTQDHWKNKGEYPTSESWEGKTYFRVYGPYEIDYRIEAQELREALTDWEFIGMEREGDNMVSLFPPKSLEGVFVEDNQATIRILENGKSPTFRHTDKTQRVNLSWLSEQFKRKWYKLIHGPSMMQAADILTKPFTNAEKWKFALKLLSHVNVLAKKSGSAKSQQLSPTQAAAAANSPRGLGAGPKPNRLLVEMCCHSESKLSEPRKESEGCHILQFTERSDLLDANVRREISRQVNDFEGDVLVWVSIPCTGGTSWAYVNLKHPTASLKVRRHVRTFHKLWDAFVKFMASIRRRVFIAIELPRNCRYWKTTKVAKFMNAKRLITYNFHGCMVGIKNRNDDPIKKPWTVATDMQSLGIELSRFQCDGSHEHIQGRGEDLRATERYTYIMTDLVHSIFRLAAFEVRPAFCATRIAPVGMIEGPSPETADVLVGWIPESDRLSVYQRIVAWEEKLNGFRADCLAIAFEDRITGVQMLGGSQQPIDIILHSCVCSNLDKNFTSYRKTRKLFEMVPQAFFGHVRRPPEGEVDVLVIGDSSTALVEAPDDPRNRKILSIGELLKGNPPAEVRNIYTKMRWGKGLGSIVAGIWEAMDEINRDCDQKGIERKRVLVMVGWAGNDVYGDHGYRGCSWIHERRYNQTPADRKVSAEFVEKQYRRVENAINDLVKLKGHGQILDIVVFGCGDASAYGLQPSYQVEMGKWFDILVEQDVMCLPTDMVSSASIRYDKLHMEDIPYNRKLMSRWLKAAIRVHLFAMKLDVASDELYRTAQFLNPDPEKRIQIVYSYPNLAQFKIALSETDAVREALAPGDMPKSLAQEAQAADESVMECVAAAVDEAEVEATREGAPKAVEFTNEELEALIPVFKEDENSDDEEVRIRRHLQEDFDEAVDAEDESPARDAQDDVPDLDTWETLEQTRTDVVHNRFDDDDMAASKDTIVVDYDTDHDIDVIPEEPKEGEKFTESGTAIERKEVPTVIVEMDVDEGQTADKEAMDVDKTDVAEATEVNQPKPEEVVAGTEETKVDEPKTTDEEKPESKDVITIPDDDTSSQLAGRPAVSEPEPSAPAAKDDKPTEEKSKAAESVEKEKKPEAKKMPRSHHTAAAPESQLSEQVKQKLEEAKERLEDAVWLDPRDLDSRIPYKRIEGNGRLRAISHKMSFYLRGHALADELPSPEMNFNDLSMDWNKLREYLDTKVWNVKDWEMLQVIRSSDTRRFQVQVSKPINAASWKGLPWQPVNVRTYQGHNAYVLGKGRFGPMIKELYSLDPEYTINQVDTPVLPRANFRPDLVDAFRHFPRIIYHSCDKSVVQKVIEYGLIPGGWPKSSGRAHNYFIATHPWDANMRKLAGTRAGKPYYVAFDVELMVQTGCRLYVSHR
eukprot:s1446_g2.t1